MILKNGWGLGAIYNNPGDGVYLFPDRDKDGKLTKNDSFPIGPDGSIRFVIFAEDVCKVGVLVGANIYSDSNVYGDIIGKPPVYTEDPLTIRGRFKTEWDPVTGYRLSDGYFMLDWDAFPEAEVTIRPPKVSIYKSDTLIPFRRDLLNESQYDLVYGIPNSIKIYVEPADSRDFPVTNGYIRLQGNSEESYIYGSIQRDGNRQSTTITYTPTGIGEGVSKLLFTCPNIFANSENPLFEGPREFAIDLNVDFDVAKALNIETDSIIPANITYPVVIKITEKGTKSPIKDVTISVSYTGFSQVIKTNDEGYARIELKAPVDTKIRIYAYLENYFEEEKWIVVKDVS